MKTRTVTIVALICSIILSSCGNDDNSIDTPQTLEEGIENQEFVTIIKENVSDLPKNVQLSIAVIDDESTEYIGVYNDNNVLRPTNNSDKIFEIGSITKIFTSVCLSKLIDDNQASLTETMQSQFDLTLQAGGDITLMQLANHTSGLPTSPTNINEIIGFDPKNPFASYTPDNLKSYLQNHISLNAENGIQYEYSNLGMGMLGYILAKKMGASYEEMVQNLIFKPLQMTSTTTLIDNVDNSKLITGWDEDGTKATNWSFTDVLSGTGSIKSSAMDMEKFIRKNFENNPVYNLPQKSTFTFAEDSTAKFSIGLGWDILELDGHKKLEHNGRTGGYISFLVIEKNHKKAVLVLSNTADIKFLEKIKELSLSFLENITN